MTRVYTLDELIAALGGPSQTTRFFNISKQTLYNWRRRAGRLPVERYFEQRGLLREEGIFAHSGLWFPELRAGKKDGRKRISGGVE